MYAQNEPLPNRQLARRPVNWLQGIILVLMILVTACSPVETSPTAPPAADLQPTSPPAASTLPPQPTATLPPTPMEATTEAMQTALLPCSEAVQDSLIQTAVPVTPEPTATGPSASPTPRPPTPTPRPAPQEDHVGFPEGYQENFKVLLILDRADNRQVRVICGNDQAASVQPGEPFPYGSILVMETWRAKQDDDGTVVKDSQGHFIRESLAGIFVMRKEQGFGEAYQGLRTGEWEYVAYRPDQEHLIPPENTANCAACHVGAGEAKDWVFRADTVFSGPERYVAAPVPGEDEVFTNSMSFFPRNLAVKAGTRVTWTNQDVVAHTVMADDSSVNSGLLNPGDEFSFKLETPGTYEYHCSIHPEQMRARIEVTE